MKPFALFGALLLFASASAQLKADRAGYWTLSVQYPRFSAKGPVARAANAAAAAQERRAFREFLAQARKEMPEIKENGGVGSYMLEVKPHRLADRATVASGYVDRYDFLAGAHGTSSFDVINFGRVRGQVRPFGLKDLFRPGEDAVGQASRAIVAALKAEKETPSLIVSGDWTRLTAAQRDRFVVGKLGLLFLFNQYDLGSGAEGPRTVLVPYAKLPGLDRRGILAGLAP